MSLPIIQTPFDYLLQMLYQYVFGDLTLVGVWLLVSALCACMANKFDFNLTMILLVPLVAGLIVATYFPLIIWAIIIMISIWLWVGVAFGLANINT